MATTVVIEDGLHVAGVTSAVEARYVQAGMFAHASPPSLAARAGVLWHGKDSILGATSSTAPMTVTVAPLHFVAVRGEADGAYLGGSRNYVTLDVAAAPASGSRIDVVFARQESSEVGIPSPDASTRGVMAIATGTSGTSPTKPAIPAGGVEIGTVTVAAGATKTSDAQVTIATTCAWTTMLGGVIPVRDATEMNALPGIRGAIAYRLDLGYPLWHNGAGMVPMCETWAGGNDAWKGAAPTAGARKISLSGTAVVSLVAGQAAIALPAIFVNGIVTAIVCAGDTVVQVGVVQATSTLTSLVVEAKTSSGAALGNGQLVRVNYRVEGW